MGLFFQTIGSSLKLLPAAVWDELHIFLTSFHKIKWPTKKFIISEKDRKLMSFEEFCTVHRSL